MLTSRNLRNPRQQRMAFTHRRPTGGTPRLPRERRGGTVGSRLERSRDRIIDRNSKSIDNDLDVRWTHDIRRREQYMIAENSVRAAAGGIDHQPARHRRLFEPLRELGLRWERRLVFAILDQFDAAEETSSANVADMGMLAEPRIQESAQLLATRPDIVEQMVAIDRLQHRKRRGADHGMA